MGRHKRYLEPQNVTIRFDKIMWNTLREIAFLETQRAHKEISAQELVVRAVNFLYKDDERVRECFRRAREHRVKKRIKDLKEKYG